MDLIVIPDSFKGTLTAIEVCDIISQAIWEICPGAAVTAIPMADGGEGTCEAFRYAMGGELTRVRVHGPFMDEKDAYYWRKDGTAVVELAAAAGFISQAELRDPAGTTTFGVGELIRHAIGAGCRKIILGLGGSCTNDGGAGIAAALGAVFTDSKGASFLPVGETLEQIAGMDLSKLHDTVRGVDFEVMCDVDNPLYGPQGAAYVFAPQKGADEAMVQVLDRNLQAFSEMLRRLAGIDVSGISGGGAAGGAGAGAVAFLNARLRPGARILLEEIGFDELLRSCDLVITGEGRLDEQSLRGKVVMTVASRAKAAHVPVIAVVGSTAGDFTSIYGYGIKKVIRAIDHCGDPDHYELTCREDLRAAVTEGLKEFGIGRKQRQVIDEDPES